ncbi:hypothetical protein D4764_05G0000690 [Takifugu flavidus]|uniref:Uncharacterized protein n=1 Tax=Takifugu flavidus TaxID=433684 RepID=A0A5C6MZ44_9TELE|nr:hypothetical protein D4764_05G0000690 [Takifugu flavidus]
MMEEIDRFQVPNAVQEAEMRAEMQPLDPASSTGSEADSDTREGEPVNYKPSPLQRKIGEQEQLRSRYQHDPSQREITVAASGPGI